MNTKEMFDQMDSKGGGSSPPTSVNPQPSDTSKMFQELDKNVKRDIPPSPSSTKETYPTNPTSTKRLEEIGNYIADKVVKQTKKDLGVLESVGSLGSGFVGFHPAMALANEVVSGSNELADWMFKGVAPTWKSLGERINQNLQRLTYEPRTEKGKETLQQIDNIMKTVPITIDAIDDKTGEHFKRDFPNTYAFVQTAGEFSSYIVAAKVYKNLVTNGVKPAIARNVVDKVIPPTDKLPVPSEGLSAKEIEKVPFSVDQTRSDLKVIKEPTKPIEKQLDLPLTEKPAVIQNNQGGMIRTDIGKKVEVLDIDGVFNDPEYIKNNPSAFVRPDIVEAYNKKHAEMGIERPEVVLSTSRRAPALLLKDIEEGQLLIDEAGIKAKVVGVTPDFGADTPIPDAKGRMVQRRNEITAWQHVLGDKFGTKIVGILDDRSDIGFADKHIKVNGELGITEGDLNKLAELYKSDPTPTVQEIAKHIGSFDPALKEHGEHVGGIVAKIGRIMDLPQNVIDNAIHAAWIHDAGKEKVPKTILNSDTSLTPDQFEVVKTHTDINDLSYIKDNPNLSPIIKNVIHYHHEKFDGTGYNHVKGTDIPIEAQIVSAADVFDALTTKSRSYRKPMSQAELLTTFEKMKGYNFDPKVVDALFEAVGLKPETVKNSWYRGERNENGRRTKLDSKSGVTFFSEDKEYAAKYGRGQFQNIYEAKFPTENVFDGSNPEHITRLLKDAKQRSENRYNRLQKSIEQIKKGNWTAIEEMLPAFKDAGFDGVFTIEEGHRNVGIFDAEKIQIVEPYEEPIARMEIKNKYLETINETTIENLSPKEQEIHASLLKLLKSEKGSTSFTDDLFKMGRKFVSKIDPGVIEEGDKVPEIVNIRKLAEERIKSEYIKLERLAKKDKITIEEILTKETDMSPEEVRDFLVTGKELTKGDKVLERSMAREISVIKNALGMSIPELKFITKELTSLENFKDLSYEDRQKVKDTLLYLYKSKFGEDFKLPKKQTIRSAAQEANRSFVSNSLSSRGFFGLKEILQRTTSDGEYYLRTHGENSKLLADKLANIRLMSDLNFSDFYATKKQLTSKLTDKEKSLVQTIVDTTKTSEIDSLNVPTHIKEAAKFIRSAFNSISESMEANGVMITDLKGKKVSYVHDAESPYWPRYYNPEELLRPGQRRNAAIKNIIQKGYADSAGGAEVLLDKILSRRMNSPKYGNMEYAREFDIEGYEKDLDIVFDNYFQKATKRIQVINTFGQQGKQALELLGNIKRESGDYVYKYATDILKRTVGGSTGSDPIAQAFADVAISYEVLTKMGRAGLRNLGQSANTVGLSSNKATAKALANIFSDPKTAMDRAQRSAAMLHSYANEFARFERGEEISGEFLAAAKIAEGMKAVSDFSLSASGFKYSEIFNRLFAAETGREYASDLFKEFKEAPLDSRSRKVAETRLKKLGLDPNTIQGTELNEFERRTAAYNFVRQTQFVNDAMSLPRWVSSENPWIRFLTLFKTFGMQQAKLVYRTMKSDPIMATKLISTMAIFGGVTAEAIDTLTQKVRDDEELLQRVARYIASGGGFGLWADTVQNSMRSSSGLAEALSGVVIGDIGTKGYALKKGIVDDEWELFRKTMTRDIPIIGPTIYNYNNN